MMKTIFFISVLMLSFFSLATQASEERITVTDGFGKTTKLGIEAYTNSTGVMEVRVDAAGIPKFMGQLNPTIAYGRDLDGDKKIDTWFFITEKGIEVAKLQGNDPLGRDILPQLLINKNLTSAKIYVTTATTAIMGFLLMSHSENNKINAQYLRDWIDLEENKIRFETELNSPGNSLTRKDIEEHYRLMSFAYRNLADTMENFAKKDLWEWAAADAGLWISGTIVLKWTGAILVNVGARLSETVLFNSVKEGFNNTVGKHLIVLKENINTLSAKLAPLKEKGTRLKSEASFALTKFNVRAAITSSIISSVAKQRLLSVVKVAFKWPKKIAVEAYKESAYIGVNIGVQLAAETAARWDEVYDPNPIKLARNVLTNKDILQDIGFMTADTILMTGVSQNLPTLKSKWIASGFVGLHDSTMINLVIKQGDDYQRIAVDTGWEVIAGNSQVQLDLWAKKASEELARKRGNPRLKLLGWAVVFIDQGVGYFGYSKTAKYFEKDPAKAAPAPAMKLIPVMAEQ